MFEAIVTLVIPAKEKLVPGTGALLSRDRVEEVEPTHTEVHRLEFDTERGMRKWLLSDQEDMRMLSAEKLVADRSFQVPEDDEDTPHESVKHEHVSIEHGLMTMEEPDDPRRYGVLSPE
jgi:hypothetical protein